MIKFIFIIILIVIIVIRRRSLQIFYYNLIFVIRIMIVGMFIFKDLRIWGRVRVRLGLNYYSIYLIILSL